MKLDITTRSALVALVALTVSSSLSAQATSAETQRKGFWFSGGLGYGSLGCEQCDERTNGVSGDIALGGTLTPRVLLGVGSTGWSKNEDGGTLTVGTLDARIRFYPSLRGRFFLTGGLGIGSIGVSVDGDSETETGTGVVLGVGYDIPTWRRASITPFLNGVGVRAGGGDANFGQLGVAITFH